MRVRKALNGSSGEIFNLIFFSVRPGRFDTFSHIYEAKPGSHFYGFDVISLYPACAMNFEYPLGKFEIKSELEELNRISYCPDRKVHLLGEQEMIGVALIKIRAPNNLREPFLGSYVNEKSNEKKFLYAFCEKCAKMRRNKPCTHSESQQGHILTLCWPEINYAVEIGYIIEQIYECYQYEKQAFIFKKFFDLLSREKIRYSEPGTNDLESYVTSVNLGMKYEGDCRLKKEDITPHEIRKKYYKDFLNAILGKMGEQSLRTKTLIVKSQNELNLLDLSSIENVFPLKKACVLFQHNNTKRSRMNPKSNSIIYSYVQCHARIHMFKAMQQLWNNQAEIYNISNDALYFSLPYPVEQCMIDFGNLFGQFKNEFEGTQILAFFSFGSKSTCFILKNEQQSVSQVIKARGFNLTNCLSTNALKCYDVKEAILKALKKEFVSIAVPQKRTKKSIVRGSAKDQFIVYQFTNVIQTNRILTSTGMSKAYGYK